MSFSNKNFNEIEELRSEYKKIDIAVDDKLQIFRYNDEFYNTISVLPRFEMTVLTHIVSVYLQDNEKYLSPIFLVIEGSAGEGKHHRPLQYVFNMDLLLSISRLHSYLVRMNVIQLTLWRGSIKKL